MSQTHLIFSTHTKKKILPPHFSNKIKYQISAELGHPFAKPTLDREPFTPTRRGGSHASRPTKNCPAFLILTKPCSNGEIPATQRPKIGSHFSIFGREGFLEERGDGNGNIHSAGWRDRRRDASIDPVEGGPRQALGDAMSLSRFRFVVWNFWNFDWSGHLKFVSFLSPGVENSPISSGSG
jgi:hypothetical protein